MPVMQLLYEKLHPRHRVLSTFKYHRKYYLLIVGPPLLTLLDVSLPLQRDKRYK